MNRKIVKILCALLAMLMLSACFASCADKDENVDPTTTTGADNGSGNLQDPNVPMLDANGYEVDTLPKLNFNDEQINVLTWNPALDELCFVLEDGRGLIEDAMFRQHVAVQERLGIEIKITQIPGKQEDSEAYLKEIEQTNMGDMPYDAVGAYSGIGASAAINGMCYNLNDLNYLNFSKPWWPDDLQNSIAVNDNLYFASGDISPNLIYGLFAIIINLDMLEKVFHDREMVYDLVDDKEWTLDKMIEMASMVYTDVNANEQKDESDTFGFVLANGVTIDAFLQGSGIDITERNEEGKLVMADSFYSAHADTVVEKMAALLKSDNCMIPSDYAGIFPSGGSMMFAGKVEACIIQLSNASFKYGVAPIPMGSKEQGGYVTTMNHNFSVYLVPNALSAEHANRSAAFLEAMASSAYRSVTPIIFEKAFQLKYSSSPRVATMFDLIRDGVKFDMARLYRLKFSQIPDVLFKNAVRNDSKWLNTVKSWRAPWNRILEGIQNDLAKDPSAG